MPRKPTGKPPGYPKGKRRKTDDELAVKFKASLAPEVVERADAMAERLGTGRSGALAYAVKAAPMPRHQKPAKH